MNKKGFTLIELLAVIVILAIIALIAVPIILNIIDDSKRESSRISAENYLEAVELAVANKNTKGKFNPKKCTISDVTKELICEGEFDVIHCGGSTLCTTADLEVKVDGEKPTEVTIVFDNGTVADGTTITIGNVSLIKENGKLTKKQEVENPKEEIEEDIEEGSEHLAQANVRAVTTPTTGIVPTQDSSGNIVPGSEFKIKVSNDIKDENGNVVEYTFFVLSNDGDYVNLIAEQNITIDGTFTSEPQANDEWYVTSSNSYDNRYGPQTAYTYLSTATSKWTNIPIIENFNYEDEGYKENSTCGYQSIVTSLDSSTGKYITTITPLSSSYGNPISYENMRARLPKYIEVTSTEVGCKKIDYSSCPLWMVNYLRSSRYYSTDKKINSTGTNFGYWLLSSTAGTSNYAYNLNYYGYVNYDYYTHLANNGIRPVITILKSDLLRVIQ